MNGSASSSSKKDAAADERLATRLFDALRRTAGLKQACKHGLASKGAVRKQIDKCITRKGRIRWRRVFRSLKSTAAEDDDDDDDDAGSLPVKLEIASGTGDWVVAQALADVGKASWAAIELRHDRVYSTLSRMALQHVPNLCVLGGDAAAIVRDHLRPGSVSHAFINFPEPPSGYQGIETASNELHLLTAAFFTDLHRVLAPTNSRLTILSDNGRYCRALCATIGGLKGSGGKALFASEQIDGPEVRDSKRRAPLLWSARK